MFCEYNALTYRISKLKGIFFRRSYWVFNQKKYARTIVERALPIKVCDHNSLVRRQLGNVDMVLQENLEVGYELHKDYWGRGFVHEAVGEIINFSFDNLDVHRIEAMIYPDNMNSKKSLESLGFQYEGLLRDYVYFRDKHQDMKMYSLIR